MTDPDEEELIAVIAEHPAHTNVEGEYCPVCLSEQHEKLRSS